MKKIMILASLAALAISGNAMALTEGVPRAVIVAGEPAGVFTAFFTANVNGPSGSCLYDVDWLSPFAPAGSVMCQISEQKSLGHTSCLANRLSDFPSVVNSIPAACSGFDQFALPQDVQLVLGEGSVTPALNGLAIFSLFPFLPRPISIL